MAKAKDLEKKEKELDAREKRIATDEKAVEEVKASLRADVSIDSVPEELELTKEQKKLVAEACEAYGIQEKYVLKARYDPEAKQAVIITHGGAKVRFRAGDKVVPLEAVRVDGIIRKKMKPLTPGPKK